MHISPRKQKYKVHVIIRESSHKVISSDIDQKSILLLIGSLK